MEGFSPPTRGDGRGELWSILLLGLLSGVLHLLGYGFQRAIFLNGLDINVSGVVLRGLPADRDQLRNHIAGYVAVTLALFGLYAVVLISCRAGRFTTGHARKLVLGFPVLFNFGLLLGRPYFSTDVFSYIAHGLIGTTLRANPYRVPVSDVANTVAGTLLVPFGWRPVHGITPYGPLWTQVELAAPRLTGDVTTAMLLLKLVVVVASLLSAALIWVILGRVRPQAQLLGTLVYLWNPMILVEFAGEGHNDALMLVFVLAALLLFILAQPGMGMVALLLGVATKFLPLILLPAHLVYAWYTRRSWLHLLVQLSLGLIIGIGITFVLYQPHWIGRDTFTGVIERGRPIFIASTSGVLYDLLSRSRMEDGAEQLTGRVLGAIFGLYVLVRSLIIRDAGDLLRASAGVAMIYMLVAAPSYWPWYATLPVALLALSPSVSALIMVFALSITARLVAPIDPISVNRWITWRFAVWSTTAIAVAIPLLLLVLISIAHVWLHWRRTGTYPVAAA